MIDGSTTAARRCRHFREPGGSIACICMDCLRTIAMDKSEANLHRDFGVHACSPSPSFVQEPPIQQPGRLEEIAPEAFQLPVMQKLR